MRSSCCHCEGMTSLSEPSSLTEPSGGTPREALTANLRRIAVKKYCDKLYEALRNNPEFLKSEAIVLPVIKAPGQARTVNVIKGGGEVVRAHKG